MAQFARPDGDDLVGGWTSAPLYQKIDEVTPSDSDFISSAGFASDVDTGRVTLSDVDDPLSSSGHVMRIRARKIVVGGDVVTFNFALRELTTTRKSVAVALTSSFSTFSYTLTATEANNIGNYDNLLYQFQAIYGSSNIFEAFVEVSWAELEVPDGPTQKSVSDSFSGAASPDITAQVPVSQAFVGSAPPSIEVSFTLADALTGAEDIATTRFLAAIPDTAVFDDADPIVQTTLTVSQSLSLAEAIAIQAEMLISDILTFFVKPVFSPSIVGLARLGTFALGHARPVSIQPQISVSDVFSGAEALETEARITVTNAFTGAEVLAFQIAVPVSQALAASETLAIDVTLSQSDSFVGSETIALESQVPISDTLTGAEALVIERFIFVVDAATGAESLQFDVTLTESDSVALSAALDINVPIPITDALVGSEAVDVNVSFTVTDAFTGTETMAITVTFPAITDALSGAEAIDSGIRIFVEDYLSLFHVPQMDPPVLGLARLGRFMLGRRQAVDITAQVPVSDTFTGAEAPTIEASMTVTDAFTGAEIALATAQILVTDSVAGAEAIAIDQLITVLDSLFLKTFSPTDAPILPFRLGRTILGAAARPVAIRVELNVNDAMVGAEALTVQAEMTVTDAGTGATIIAVEAQIPVTDTVAGAEALSIDKFLTIFDRINFFAFSPIDASILPFRLGRTPLGQARRPVDIRVSFTLTDTMAGAESVAVIQFKDIADSFAATENVLVEQLITVSDSGIGLEVVIVVKTELEFPHLEQTVKTYEFVTVWTEEVE